MTTHRLDRLVQAMREGRYRLTLHAEHEREADAVLIGELVEAFGSESVELVEEYDNDPRGPSALVLGFTAMKSPLHAVVGFASPDIVVFITIYRPDPDLWKEWRARQQL